MTSRGRKFDYVSDDTVENVLILQGGGSLGAFGCGVFKALANRNVKIDIIAGTSIGGLNASIIAGSKGEDHPEKALEQYWLELGEDSSANFNSPFLEGLATNPIPTLTPLPPPPSAATTTDHSAMTHISQFKSVVSFYTSAIYGDDKIFVPRWRPEFAFTDPQYFTP